MKEHIEYTQLGCITTKELKKLVEYTNKMKPRALVVSHSNVLLVRKFKLDTNIKLVTVGGFPFEDLDSALFFNRNYDELDIVIPLREYYGKGEILEVHKVITKSKKIIGKKVLKVILETALISNHSKEYVIPELVRCIEDAGGDIIKTNTGKFKEQMLKKGTRKRTFEDLIEDVKRIQDWTDKPIKAAGGIKTKEQAEKLLALGVKYIGTSSTFWEEV